MLVSPVLDHRPWSCVRLVYQIAGRGSLQLHLRPDSDNFDYRLWEAHEASDSWLIASVDLPNSTAPFQVGVASTRASPEPTRVRSPGASSQSALAPGRSETVTSGEEQEDESSPDGAGLARRDLLA